jgi:FkbM family methyltransferase
MRNVGRKLAFVLAATNHGSMIINRFDHRMLDTGRGYGTGYQLLETGSGDAIEIELGSQLLELRRRYHGDGVVAIDCGANIGVHTIEWATAMTGWGSVMAIEPQERVYYALAGNIAINNCFNAVAMHAAAAAETGIILVPTPDYLEPSSFGNLELKQSDSNEYIGQDIDYAAESGIPVQKIAIDALELPRVDLIKLDVEGMEMDALAGAKQTVERSKPIVLVETDKTDREALRAWLEQREYVVVDAGVNLLAIHRTDETLTQLQLDVLAQSSAA